MVDLTFIAHRDTSKEEINALMRDAAGGGTLKGVLGYNDLPLVSIDFNHTHEASIFDSTLTKVSNGNLVKVGAWYDNEWGFSVQMLKTARAMMQAA
jgi:glyceraldehyde 3-phosphate dehydrogenase